MYIYIYIYIYECNYRFLYSNLLYTAMIPSVRNNAQTLPSSLKAEYREIPYAGKSLIRGNPL